MDVDSLNYYEILGILPQATKQEVKTAYYQISKELHPDKIPPDTPKLARSILEEKYKIVTQAYSCLIDPDQRRNYDRQINIYQYNNNSSDNNQQNNSSYQEDDFTAWFDEAQIRLAAENLKIKLGSIERNAEEKYSYQINLIEQELLIALKQLNYQGKINDIPHLADKRQSMTNGIIIGLIGLVVLFFTNSLLGIIGIVLIFIGMFKIIRGSQMSLNYHKKTLIAKKIYQDFINKKEKYLQQITEEISQERGKIKLRIQHFQSIPISTITKDFFCNLSSEDKILLLVAINENQSSLKTEDQEIIKVVLGIGSMVVLLGIMGLIGL